MSFEQPTSQDVVVEDNDALVQYGPADKWSQSTDPSIIAFGTTYHLTGTLGAWAALSFTGTRIWYFADKLNSHGDFGASIDGGPLAVYSSFNTALLTGQVLFYAQLKPGPHTINITNLEDTKVVGLDRFVYRPLGVDDDSSSKTSASEPTPSESSGQLEASPTSRSNLSTGGYVGIGLAAGAIALLLVLVIVVYWTRRRRQPQHWDAGSIGVAHAARPWSDGNPGVAQPPSRQWSQFTASQPQVQPQAATELPAYDSSSHSRTVVPEGSAQQRVTAKQQ